VAVASAEPYANHLHLTADRWPRHYLITRFFTGRMLFLMPNQHCQSTVAIIYARDWCRNSIVWLISFKMCQNTSSNGKLPRLVSKLDEYQQIVLWPVFLLTPLFVSALPQHNYFPASLVYNHALLLGRSTHSYSTCLPVYNTNVIVVDHICCAYRSGISRGLADVA